jgi:SAM-dependent methyltransferase
VAQPFLGQDFTEISCLLGNAEHLPFRDASFQLVVASHVIEHLYDPVSGLAECRRVLAKHGLLSVGVPNFDASDRRAFGLCWIGWSMPRHLVHFNKRSLGTALRLAGFESFRVGVAPMSGWGKSFIAKMGIKPHLMDLNPTLQWLALLGLPLEFLAHARGSSDGLFAIATT